MAKRTYWKHGYKKKRRKRGTPEFSTVAEQLAYEREQKEKKVREHPCSALRGDLIDDASGIDVMKKLEDVLGSKLDGTEHEVKNEGDEVDGGS